MLHRAFSTSFEWKFANHFLSMKLYINYNVSLSQLNFNRTFLAMLQNAIVHRFHLNKKQLTEFPFTFVGSPIVHSIRFIIVVVVTVVVVFLNNNIIIMILWIKFKILLSVAIVPQMVKAIRTCVAVKWVFPLDFSTKWRIVDENFPNWKRPGAVVKNCAMNFGNNLIKI